MSATTIGIQTRPLVTFLSMEDHVGTSLSKNATSTISQAVQKRLLQKSKIFLTSSKKIPKQFEVSMQLLQQEESIHSQNEITIGIHLKIVDMRDEKHRTILQEMLKLESLLDKPFKEIDKADLQGEQFWVSPLGLAHAKIARDIATRIEDYVLLAIKGK